MIATNDERQRRILNRIRVLRTDARTSPFLGEIAQDMEEMLNELIEIQARVKLMRENPFSTAATYKKAIEELLE